ncbi:MAG: DNA primase catalytic subunit PriS [Candidatus Heimdallarchaeota archaeon]
MTLYQKRQLIRDYYASYFDLQDLSDIIDLTNFSYREFGFISLHGKFFRNLSFETPHEFVDFLVDRTPTDVYVGAVFDTPPTRETPIHTLEWRGHELVFDLDLTDYDAVRKFICSCQGAEQVCHSCWQLITLAIEIIDETLRMDFGLENITWVFSGRRGVHGWIKDDIGFNLDQEQRKAIVDYMSIVHGEGETARVHDRTKLRYDFRKRIEQTVFRYFLRNIKRKDLIELGFSANTASDVIRQLKHQDGLIDENFMRRFNLNLAKINKYDEILRRWAPRIDHKVTIDLRRLLRLPTSIHGKTGHVARILLTKDILSFDPESEESVFL